MSGCVDLLFVLDEQKLKKLFFDNFYNLRSWRYYCENVIKL